MNAMLRFSVLVVILLIGLVAYGWRARTLKKR